jgi:drug/metabolite transporter (DMT)-like permease
MNLPKDNLKGAAFMAASITGFTLNEAVMKLVLATTPLIQSLFLRSVASSAILLGLVLFMRVPLPRREQLTLPLIARIFCELFGTICFFLALANIPLANAAAIVQMTPLVVSVVSWMVFKTPFGWIRFAAILTGLLGVYLVVDPAAADFSPASFYALGTVLFFSMRDLLTRGLPAGLSSYSVAFATAVACMLVSGLLSPIEGGLNLTLVTGVQVVCAALFICFGYVYGAMAPRVGDLSFSAPFRYVGLPLSLVAGYVLFGDVPTPMKLIGCALIILAGAVPLQIERRRARELGA